MVKKLLVLAMVLVMAAGMTTAVFAEEAAAETGASVSVGGHIKMTVFDTVHVTSQVPGVRESFDRFYGVRFNEIDLFISGKMNDWISFEVDPKFSASSGATPKLGTTTTAVSKEFTFAAFGHGKAVLMFELPADVHLEVGVLHPIFTMEYGKELFWEDESNGGPFVVAHGAAGAYHDAGIEASKTFDFGDISLPVYLYYVNGLATAGAVDNNNQPGVMIHIEPVWGPFTVSGSIYAKKADDLERNLTTGWTAGLAFKWEGLTIRSEYAKGFAENGISAGVDAQDEGYFGKAMYKVLPWLQFSLAHESYTEYIGGAANKTVRSLRTTPGAQLFLTDSTILIVNCDIFDAKLTDLSKTISYIRPGINFRVTF